MNSVFGFSRRRIGIAGVWVRFKDFIVEGFCFYRRFVRVIFIEVLGKYGRVRVRCIEVVRLGFGTVWWGSACGVIGLFVGLGGRVFRGGVGFGGIKYKFVV